MVVKLRQLCEDDRSRVFKKEAGGDQELVEAEALNLQFSRAA